MSGGRPTKYEGNKTLKEVGEYRMRCITDETIPTIAGLAVFLEVGRQSIYDWKKEHDEFSYILDKMLAEQESQLIKHGLNGTYNATIAKLIMATHHGYSDKQAVDHTSKGEKMGPLMIVNAPKQESDEHADVQSD